MVLAATSHASYYESSLLLKETRKDIDSQHGVH